MPRFPPKHFPKFLMSWMISAEQSFQNYVATNIIAICKKKVEHILGLETCLDWQTKLWSSKSKDQGLLRQLNVIILNIIYLQIENYPRWPKYRPRIWEILRLLVVSLPSIQIHNGLEKKESFFIKEVLIFLQNNFSLKSSQVENQEQFPKKVVQSWVELENRQIIASRLLGNNWLKRLTSLVKLG